MMRTMDEEDDGKVSLRIEEVLCQARGVNQHSGV
jgi:hypothetical protein